MDQDRVDAPFRGEVPDPIEPRAFENGAAIAVVLDDHVGRDVVAAKLRGESALFIMLVEILPNARSPIIVEMCLRMGFTTVMIGILGFLGIGLPPPHPDWGSMVKDTYGLIFSWPHMALFPCAAISSLVIGFNLMAIGLREYRFHG